MNDQIYSHLLNRLEFLRGGLVTELGCLPADAFNCLSIRERRRTEGMGPRRLLAYIGARFTLKMLTLHLYPQLRETRLDTLDTVDLDPALPCLPTPPGQDRIYCSVSHDKRFVTAVAARRPVGVDVEAVSDTVLRGRRMFMSKEEIQLSIGSPLGEMGAALRIWSIKEAASKALGLTLSQAWKEVEAVRIGEWESYFRSHGRRSVVYHTAMQGHLFTILN